jgi:hypothetical protein
LTGTFPNLLKIPIVRLFHKKGDKTNMSNYRPILLLTAFSKIIENVIYNRISQNLEANDILVPERFDFRKGICTENAAFELTDYTLKSLNYKMHVGIFCHLAKVFDCVNHEILLTKLR